MHASSYPSVSGYGIKDHKSDEMSMMSQLTRPKMQKKATDVKPALSGSMDSTNQQSSPHNDPIGEENEEVPLFV